MLLTFKKGQKYSNKEIRKTQIFYNIYLWKIILFWNICTYCEVKIGWLKLIKERQTSAATSCWLIVLKGLEQLELHDGQLTGVSILAAKGSHLSDSPGGFAVSNMWREELELPLSPLDMRLWRGGFAVCNMCREELDLPLNPVTCDCLGGRLRH